MMVSLGVIRPGRNSEQTLSYNRAMVKHGGYMSVHYTSSDVNVKYNKDTGTSRDGSDIRLYYPFISQGLFAIVHVSRIFQKCATTDLSMCRRF